MHPYLFFQNSPFGPRQNGAGHDDLPRYTTRRGKGWLRAAMRRWERRKMAAALHALPDHLLNDIGIRRGNIRLLVDDLDDRELSMRPVSPRLARSHAPRARAAGADRAHA
ncbi:DUF1127 domain-containing protein [Palleronia sediminis]|nr:DUF1127 domain-containing protein [Palleronia sediminis]